MSDVFISYSRNNKDFAVSLFDALAEHNISTWVDWQDIPLSAGWWDEIKRGIDNASTFIFLMSDDSLQSTVCALELAHAIEYGKRIIPVHITKTSFDVQIPDTPTDTLLLKMLAGRNLPALVSIGREALQERNWIFFNQGADGTPIPFADAIATLIDTVNTDLEFDRQQARLIVQMKNWKSRGTDDFLLIGSEIDDGEAWLDKAKTRQHGLSNIKIDESLQVLTTYITHSRQVDTRRKRTLRNLRLGGFVAGTIAVIGVVISIITGSNAVVASSQASTSQVQANENLITATIARGQANIANTQQAEAQAIRATAQSENFLYQMAGQAQINQSDESIAMPFAYEAVSVNQPPIDVLSVFYQSFHQSYNRLSFIAHEDWVTSVAYSPDGTKIATGSCHATDPDFDSLNICIEGEIKLWNTGTGEQEALITTHVDSVVSLDFNPDGRLIASIGCGTKDLSIFCDSFETTLWDVDRQETVAQLDTTSDWLTTVKFSPDGHTLITVGCSYENTDECQSGLINVWDIASGQILYSLNDHTDIVTDVAFHPDSSRFVTSSNDGTVRLWTVTDGEFISTLGTELGFVNSVAFSPDGHFVSSDSSENTIKVWDIRGSIEVATLTGHSRTIRSIAYSPDGDIIVSASCVTNAQVICRQGEIRYWSTTLFEEVATLFGHDDWINEIRFSPDGERLVSVGNDHMVSIWDISPATHVHTLEEAHGVFVSSVDYSADGRLLASASVDSWIKLWDLETYQLIHIFEGHRSGITQAIFNPQSTQLASAGGDELIKLWDVASGEELLTIEGHEDDVQSLAFSPDGQRLVSGAFDETVRLWDVQTGDELLNLTDHTDRVWAVAFSPIGNIFASGGSDDTVRLWDATTGEPIHILVGHADRIWAIAFSPDGRLLASSSDDETVRLWDVETGEHLHTLIGHSEWVRTVAFSPDGKILASGSNDETIRLWDTATGDPLLVIEDRGSEVIYGVAFHPDQSQLASGDGEGHVKFWRVGNLAEMRQWTQNNRYIREFTCEERARFNLAVLCDENGQFPTRTPYPTPSMIPLPSWTPFWTPQPTATTTLLPASVSLTFLTATAEAND